MNNNETHYAILVSKGPIRKDGSLGQDGLTGKTGQNGEPAVNSENPNGQDGTRKGLFFKKCHCAGDGSPGASATSDSSIGGTGIVGGNGSTPPPLILRVNTFQLPENIDLNIQCRGGNGGRGGTGGQGGAGAIGGNAGTNVDACLENQDCQPASGGPGGNGGWGGKGGMGGNAGDGGNVWLYYVNNDDQVINRVVPNYLAGKPGLPGKKGVGGEGGKGGQNEVWPRDSKPTFAPVGDPGEQLGDDGGGNTAGNGNYYLKHVSKIPPSSD